MDRMNEVHVWLNPRPKRVLASRDNATQPVVGFTCLQCRLAMESVQNFEEKMSKLAKDRLPSDEKRSREGIFTTEEGAPCQRALKGSQARWRANSSSADRWSQADDEAGTTQVGWFTLLQRAALPDGGRQSLAARVDFPTASRMQTTTRLRRCSYGRHKSSGYNRNMKSRSD